MDKSDQIKILCDKIRQFIDDNSKYEEYLYKDMLIIPTMEFHNFIDKIEKESEDDTNSSNKT